MEIFDEEIIENEDEFESLEMSPIWEDLFDLPEKNFTRKTLFSDEQIIEAAFLHYQNVGFPYRNL